MKDGTPAPCPTILASELSGASSEATVQLTMKVNDGSDQTAVFEVSDADLPGELVLAARPGAQTVDYTTRTLDQALADVEPTLKSVAKRLKSIAPDRMEIEFGLKVGGEAGLVFAKGTAEVNFVVRMSWKAS
jgi:hypothetical protein